MIRFCTVALAALFTLTASAQPWTGARPDGHAPIGVMGDHVHGAGDVMISYRSMWMPMFGNRTGTSTRFASEVVSPPGQPGFRVAPIEMAMRMDMVGVMVAPSRKVTLMAMVPFLTMDMDHATFMDPPATAFTTASSGLGDVSVTALARLASADRITSHLGLGVSLPTGTISATDDTPMGEDQLLPYPMQLGSGTVDLLPSATYLGQSDRIGWGVQGRGTVRLGTNDRDYALGDRAGLTTWGSVVLTDAISLSLRADGQAWGNVRVADGLGPADPGYPYGMAVLMDVVPTVRPDLRAGERVDVLFGVNAVLTGGPAKGLRFAVEAGVPAYERLAGPQPGTEAVITAGFQYAFRP